MDYITFGCRGRDGFTGSVGGVLGTDLKGGALDLGGVGNLSQWRWRPVVWTNETLAWATRSSGGQAPRPASAHGHYAIRPSAGGGGRGRVLNPAPSMRRPARAEEEDAPSPGPARPAGGAKGGGADRRRRDTAPRWRWTGGAEEGCPARHAWPPGMGREVRPEKRRRRERRGLGFWMFVCYWMR